MMLILATQTEVCPTELDDDDTELCPPQIYNDDTELCPPQIENLVDRLNGETDILSEVDSWYTAFKTSVSPQWT